ncbi:hypothetical protein E2C01_087752 [Portunus trituberculatus]|uniref:Uncharacterized protein n=1 Tax=Portunus trituberculatus TaxID=210409 RepID=A0A5B7J4C5_PORTR|nr:hypothetical protein [Portunus trituberculatus]
MVTVTMSNTTTTGQINKLLLSSSVTQTATPAPPHPRPSSTQGGPDAQLLIGWRCGARARRPAVRPVVQNKSIITTRAPF